MFSREQNQSIKLINDKRSGSDIAMMDKHIQTDIIVG